MQKVAWDELSIEGGSFINNTWVSSNQNGSLEVNDKYSQTPLATLPLASEGDLELAISGAQQAFNTLRTWSAGQRANMLHKLKDAVETHQDAFATLIAAEAGKPISYARNEVERCLVTLETAAREAISFKGEVIPIDFDQGTGKQAVSRRFPIGPIVAISPFNFPLNLALHKIAPAFAVGCSVVLKPAPQTPLVALAFAALVKEVGYPAGALNVMLASNDLAEKLVVDDRLQMLSFTGSAAVGWYLKTIAGKKRVALELGGNAAVIVTPSANLETAAKSIAYGSYLYAGQVCISTQRILVESSIIAQFQNLLLAEITALKSGASGDSEVINGPVISKADLNRIHAWVDEAVDEGAQVLCGHQVLEEKGNVYAPTLLTQTQPNMKVVAEEVFVRSP